MRVVLATLAAVALVGCTAVVDGAEPLLAGAEVPAFALEDVNPASALYGQLVGPSDYVGEASVWYFGHANCGYCSSQFGRLDALAAALESEGVTLAIAGINAAGLEEHNPTIMDGRVLPWLQDTDGAVWTTWAAVWRDLFLVDGEGLLVDRVNLTDFDLNNTENYDALDADMRALVGSP